MRPAGWLTAATLTLVGTGCSNSSVSSTPSAAPTPPPAASTAAIPPAAPTESRDTLDILSLLSVEHEVDVLASRDGVAVEIFKEEGNPVKAGETMGRLDDRVVLAELQKAEAELQIALNNVKYNEAELKAKKANLRRQQQLREMGLSSDADLEQAQFLAKGQEYDLASWRANVERSQAEVRRLQLELEKTRIRAPFSGVVARRYVRQGQDVVKDEKCFRVSQLGPLLVRFQVPENSGRPPQPDDTLQVSLVSDNRRLFPARIHRVSPVVDPASGSYDVSARLTGPGLKDLRPGMAVRVLWQIGARSARK